jgi:peptide-methionine (S)-S-oxide reductase
MKYLALILFASLFGCSNAQEGGLKNELVSNTEETNKKEVTNKLTDNDNLQEAYFASGCFWCVEAIFQSVKGIEDAISGYSGGKASTANYRAVSSGSTQHAEFVKVIYDPEVIDYKTLLMIFFDSHEYWTLNRQGPDAGTQYRSAIYYQTEEEKELIDAYIKKLKESAKSNVTTEVAELQAFYEAEDYHQEYEHNNPNNSYVKAVSVPRLNKFKKKHPELLK